MNCKKTVRKLLTIRTIWVEASSHQFCTIPERLQKQKLLEHAIAQEKERLQREKDERRKKRLEVMFGYRTLHLSQLNKMIHCIGMVILTLSDLRNYLTSRNIWGSEDSQYTFCPYTSPISHVQVLMKAINIQAWELSAESQNSRFWL